MINYHNKVQNRPEIDRAPLYFSILQSETLPFIPSCILLAKNVKISVLVSAQTYRKRNVRKLIEI